MTTLTPDETILGLLAVQARHGYDLLDCFRRPDQLGRVWNLSTSQLYAVLKRLEKNGWILGAAIETENAPIRVEYALTPTGEAALDSWLHNEYPSASIRCVRVEFLSRLYVARALNLPTITIVQYQRASCEQERSTLIAEREHAAPGIDYLALEFVIAQLDAVLKWIERCELIPTFPDDEPT